MSDSIRAVTVHATVRSLGLAGGLNGCLGVPVSLFSGLAEYRLL
ncbi:MAG: hypothetical protein ACKVHE_29225 [Planctomycetales bacterium]